MEQVAVVVVPFAAQGQLNSCCSSPASSPPTASPSTTSAPPSTTAKPGLASKASAVNWSSMGSHSRPPATNGRLLARNGRKIQESRRRPRPYDGGGGSGGKPFPVEHPKELPSFDGCSTVGILYLASLQVEPLSNKAGDIYNTCGVIEAPYIEALEREKNTKCWAIYRTIAPLLPINIMSENYEHECLGWLNKQEPKSVIYVSFGTTVSLSDEQINELAHGLERSKVKFLWVLRDADKGDVFDGEVRRAELPEGFEERVRGEGMVVREWAPQPQILGHPSIGGFMSHCGWNSCLESITMGVAIAVWPMHSDQPRNAALITEYRYIENGGCCEGMERERDWK
ncbi:hypothetical protein C2S52_021279 [Perilla frutescens var. hirtella]|nr:hypothetical protein C2S52_021279 [Perilla frutescens var. hirtella]